MEGGGPVYAQVMKPSAKREQFHGTPSTESQQVRWPLLQPADVKVSPEAYLCLSREVLAGAAQAYITPTINICDVTTSPNHVSVCASLPSDGASSRSHISTGAYGSHSAYAEKQ